MVRYQALPRGELTRRVRLLRPIDVTVIGTFDRTLKAEDALRELEREGIARNEISLVAQPADGRRGSDQKSGAGAGAGAILGGVAGLLLGGAAGPVGAALAAGGIGAASGGLIGALTGIHIPEDDAKYYAEQVRQGSALVIVHADRAVAARARDILDRAGARESMPGVTEERIERDELAASSRPDVPQLTRSGARLYDVPGLEFDPVKSRFEDFGKS